LQSNKLKSKILNYETDAQQHEDVIWNQHIRSPISTNRAQGCQFAFSKIPSVCLWLDLSISFIYVSLYISMRPFKFKGF